MVKKITSSILAFLLITSVAYADKAEAANENDTTEQIAARQLSREAQILASYLAKFNSPLQYHAQDFIDSAKTYPLLVNSYLVDIMPGVGEFTALRQFSSIPGKTVFLPSQRG